MNNLKENKKYIVVHAGKRDDYQVALALHENNMLSYLITDIYFPLHLKWFSCFLNKLGMLSKCNKRYNVGLPFNKTIFSFKSLICDLLFHFTKKDFFLFKKDFFLGQKANKISKKFNLPIVSMNTYAYDAFYKNATAAMESTSVGIMQVMGFNHKVLGFKTVGEMWDYAKESEVNQLRLGLRFIKSNPKMYKAAQTATWETFAYYYNGSQWRKFNYSERLEKA